MPDPGIEILKANIAADSSSFHPRHDPNATTHVPETDVVSHIGLHGLRLLPLQGDAGMSIAMNDVVAGDAGAASAPPPVEEAATT